MEAKPKILLLGAHGQLGLAICAKTRLLDWPIAAFGRDQADLQNYQQLDEVCAAHRPDLLINAGAYTNVDKAEAEPDLAFAINRTGAGNAARAAQNHEIPIIHISTNFVFDGTNTQPYGCTEPTNPRSVYGLSKLAGEAQVKQMNAHALIIRTAGVFYEYGHNFVATMARIGRTKPNVQVVDDQFIQPTYASHLAMAILQCAPALVDGGAKQTIYHYTDQSVCSWAEFAASIFGHMNIDCRVDPIPSSAYPLPASRPENGVLDNADFCREFDFSSQPWLDGLKSCHARWVKEGIV